MTSSNSKTPVLARQAQVNEKLAFSKASTLGAVFENLHFRCPKTAILFDRKAETDKLKSSFPEMYGYVWVEPKIRDIPGKKGE